MFEFRSQQRDVPRRPSRGWGRVACVGGLAALIAIPAFGQGISTTDEEFLAGLRARGLYDLAAVYCEQQLAQQRSGLARAGWGVELSRTSAAKARSVAPPEREPLWAAALAALDEAASEPATSGSELLGFQRGLVYLQQGELGRREAEAAHDVARLEPARDVLRRALEQLRTVDEQLQTRLHEVASGSSRPVAGKRESELDQWQLRRLQANVRFQLATIYRELAATYPVGSADRVAAAGQAVEILTPLQEKAADDPLAWDSRLAMLDALRLVGRTQETRTRGQQLLQTLPAALRAQLIATMMLLELDADNVDTAMRLAETSRELAPQSSPELDDAHLQALLRAAQPAAGGAASEDAGRQAAELADQIVQRWGPMWGRLAQARSGRGLSMVDGNVELLVRSAESLYRGGQVDDALAAYDRAIEAAAGAPARGFQLAFVAATIEHQRENYVAAAERYLAAALAHPDQPDAPRAHLLSAYNLAAVLRATSETDLTAYEQRLLEHRQRWPASPTTDQAALWLGKLYEAGRQWPEAIDAYSGVSGDSDSFVEALQNVARCYQSLLAARHAADEPTEQIARDAADSFLDVITRGTDRWPQQWNAVDRAAALTAVRLWLQYVPSANQEAIDLLEAALAAAGERNAEWTAAAQLWLAIAYAKRGNMTRAEHLLPREEVPVTEMLDALEVLGSGRDIATRQEAARITLRQLEQLTRGRVELAQADRQRMQRLQAAALANAGQHREAIVRYRELVQQQPRDVELLRSYADLLAGEGETDEALGVWQKLEKAAAKRSTEWFEAKYQLARLHGQLGNAQRGLQIIQVTEVLHPDLGGPELKARFEQLKAELGR